MFKKWGHVGQEVSAWPCPKLLKVQTKQKNSEVSITEFPLLNTKKVTGSRIMCCKQPENSTNTGNNYFRH